MLIDKENLFANASTLTAAAQIGDVIDLGVKGGLAEEMKFFVNVDTAFTGTAGGTTKISVQACDYAGFGTSPVTLCTSGTVALASMVAGARLYNGVVPTTSKRYLRLYSASSITFTAGKIDAGLIMQDQTNTQTNS